MSGQSSGTPLKELLISWNLAHLFGRFQDEGINIEDLKIMKPHHVAELLHNYRMSVRIRFEHNFEAWRRSLNKPLRDTMQYVHCCSSTIAQQSTPKKQVCSSSTNTDPVVYRFRNKSSTTSPLQSPTPTSLALPTPLPTSSIASSSASPSTIVHALPRAPAPPAVASPAPPPTQAPAYAPPVTTSTSVSSRQDPVKELTKLIQQPRLSIVSTTGGSVSSSSPSVTVEKHHTRSHGSSAAGITQLVVKPPATSLLEPSPPVPIHLYDSVDRHNADNQHLSLIQMLESSGVKGAALLDFYREHQELTTSHRLMLIHLIVAYFENNDFHLSLNMSHNIEWQILQLFPTEKLEYYRTEKRGKIYVKFCNMKRYKRDRSTQKRKWESIGNVHFPKELELIDGNTEDEDFPINFDGWDENPPVEVQVKTEHLSDDDIY